MRWLGKAGLSDLVALWWVAGNTDWTSQGGGGGGEREREQSTITVEKKIFWLKHCYTYIHIT